jgi:hypothetical protein
MSAHESTSTPARTEITLSLYLVPRSLDDRGVQPFGFGSVTTRVRLVLENGTPVRVCVRARSWSVRTWQVQSRAVVIVGSDGGCAHVDDNEVDTPCAA